MWVFLLYSNPKLTKPGNYIIYMHQVFIDEVLYIKSSSFPFPHLQMFTLNIYVQKPRLAINSSPYQKIFYCLGLPSNSQVPELPAQPNLYRVFVHCDVLPPIHTCLKVIYLMLVTGTVTACLLKTPVNYPVILLKLHPELILPIASPVL